MHNASVKTATHNLTHLMGGVVHGREHAHQRSDEISKAAEHLLLALEEQYGGDYLIPSLYSEALKVADQYALA